MGHFTHGLAEALIDRGNAVTVFSQDPAPPGARYAVERVSVSDGRASPLAFPWALRRSAFDGFDVIHAQGDEQWLSHRSTPVVRTLHGTALAEAWFNGVRGRSMKRLCLHLYFYVMEFIADLRADRVAAVSAGTGRFYPRLHAVIPNGIDIPRFASAASATSKSSMPSIVFIGELDSRKRGRWLVDLFLRDVRPRVPDAELWLVSPDADRVPAAPGIVPCGPQDDESLARLLARAWVMCLPSAYEGFGRPYAEAMAAGTVAVATPNPGADDVLDRGRAGVIAGGEGLGDALVTVLGDSNTRDRLIAAGRARVQSYAWPVVAQAYEQLYATAIRARRGLRQ